MWSRWEKDIIVEHRDQSELEYNRQSIEELLEALPPADIFVPYRSLDYDQYLKDCMVGEEGMEDDFPNMGGEENEVPGEEKEVPSPEAMPAGLSSVQENAPDNPLDINQLFKDLEDIAKMENEFPNVEGKQNEVPSSEAKPAALPSVEENELFKPSDIDQFFKEIVEVKEKVKENQDPNTGEMELAVVDPSVIEKIIEVLKGDESKE